MEKDKNKKIETPKPIYDDRVATSAFADQLVKDMVDNLNQIVEKE